MSLDNLDKRRFLQVLEEWSSHRVYFAQAVADKLTECGLEAMALDDGQAVLIEGVLVKVVQPEWGSPGISPQSVLSVVYELSLGTRPQSQMIGRGFWYRDGAGKLRESWFPERGTVSNSKPR